MDVQKVTKEYRLAQWARILQDRADSGQKIKDFCQASGISKDAFYYWQRKLRKSACEALAKTEGEKNNLSFGWAQLTPLQTQNSSAALDIEINRCLVKVSTETDTELLKKVCKVLIEL